MIMGLLDDLQLDEMPEEEPSPWMTLAEAARYLRVTKHTLHAYARAGKLVKYHVPDYKTIRVKRTDIEALLVPRVPA